MATDDVRVRFAPSPTGVLHLGSALAAVANAAFARTHGGTLVLRIDDTDVARSRAQLSDELVKLLRWLGIAWDEGPVHQSQRGECYRGALAALERDGHTYPCFCTAERLAELAAAQRAEGAPPRYDERCRELEPGEEEERAGSGEPHVTRLRVPHGRDVRFHDLVRGHVEIPAGSFGDPVLARSDGSAGYLLASVVDDTLLAITHVIRGEDHLSNSARQVLLFEALGSPAPPAFAHLPLLRDAAGRKLSKRAPLGTLDELVTDGFDPRAVRRYLAELLGQGAVDPLIAGSHFDVGRVPAGAPKVDRARLESLGREEMAALSDEQLIEIAGAASRGEWAPLLREFAEVSPTSHVLRQAAQEIAREPDPTRVADALAALEGDPATALQIAAAAFEASADTAVGLATLRTEAKARGIATRQALVPLRLALCGEPRGPALGSLVAALGVEAVRVRVLRARAALGGNVAPAG